MSDEVSVVVPVWNRRELLEPLLARLRAQTYPIAEVLVVDNGSEDGSAEAAERQGARVVRMGSNTGFARAVNRGIRECRTPWLALLNNDVEPAPDWLAHLLAAALSTRAWFVTGKLFNAARRDRLDGTWDALCRGGCALRVGHGRPDGPAFSALRPIRFAPATAALYRAELFEKIGGFDETFESYLEDVDFGLRCALAGYPGFYVPQALAWHQGSATLGKWHPASVRRVARNQVLLVAKHYPPRTLRRYAWPILIAHALWGLVAVRHGAGWAYIRGKFEGLRLGRRLRQHHEDVAEILELSECEIHNVQRETGYDWYWRMYFLLTRGRKN